MSDPLSPRPGHLLWTLPFLTAGALCFRSSEWYWVVLGVMLWAVAWVIVGWLVLASTAEHRSRYWESVAGAINAAAAADVDRLAALGFTSQKISALKLEVTDRRDGRNTTKYFDLPLSGHKLAPIARAVRDGATFTERVIVDDLHLLTSNEFRKLRASLVQQGHLMYRDVKDPRQGFVWTDEGVDLFKQLGEING